MSKLNQLVTICNRLGWLAKKKCVLQRIFESENVAISGSLRNLAKKSGVFCEEFLLSLHTGFVFILFL